MASGDTVAIFTPLHNEPPATSYATIDIRNNHPCLDFDAASSEQAVFSSILPQNYGGSGITVYATGAWSSDTDDGHTTALEFSFERIGNAQQDVDIDSFTSGLTALLTVDATSGKTDIGNKAFSNGAEIDSIAVGELFRFKVTCNTTGSDHTGDFELYGIELKET